MTDCCKAYGESKGQENYFLCPQCGREGQPVNRTTIDALLKPESLSQVTCCQYAFCETPSCPVVYSAADGSQLTKEHVRVRVGLKETEDPVLACYCFHVTRSEERRVGKECRL